MSTLPDSAVDPRSLLATQATESVVIEMVGADQLPLRRKGAAEPVSVDRLSALVAAALPDSFGGVSLFGFETAWEAMAPETRRAFTDDLSCYLAWCTSEKRRAFPADPEDLVRYLRWLEQGREFRPATLTRRIASLSRIHRILNLSSRDTLPTRAAMVADALKAALRVRRRIILAFWGIPAIGRSACRTGPQCRRWRAMPSARQGIGASYKRLARAVIDAGLVKVEPGREGTLSGRSASIRCGWA